MPASAGYLVADDTLCLIALCGKKVPFILLYVSGGDGGEPGSISFKSGPSNFD